MSQQKIEFFPIGSGQDVEVKVDTTAETVWLSQKQMATLFDKDIRTVNEHVLHIFKDEELEKETTIRNFQIVQTEGSRKVKRNIDHYNLDMIISVGYRVNSKRGVQFRRWATQRLKDYLINGYALNQQRFEQNAAELEQALALIKKTAQSPAISGDQGRGLVEVVSRYTQTFLWLQRYDEGLLEAPAGQLGGVLRSPDEAMQALNDLKAELMQRGEATDLFAKPRGDGLASIFGNLEQSVFGEAAYPTIESKAAHLLYFMVKNHPFSDGNKRSGAFLFIDFLNKNNRLLNADGEMVINDTGLAALTLLVAESDPKQKETLIHLIMNMLSVANER